MSQLFITWLSELGRTVVPASSGSSNSSLVLLDLADERQSFETSVCTTWHDTLSQKTWISSSTAVKTSNHISMSYVSVLCNYYSYLCRSLGLNHQWNEVIFIPDRKNYGCTVTCQAGTQRRQRCSSTHIHRRRHHAPATLPPNNRPRTNCTWDSMGPAAGQSGSGKSRPYRGSNPGHSSP
jgi:hypothetical protein